MKRARFLHLIILASQPGDRTRAGRVQSERLTTGPRRLSHSIRHDSEHDTWMRDHTDRSVLFVETEIAFLGH